MWNVKVPETIHFCSGRLDEAFSHCIAVWRTKAFQDSLEWVACCVDMFEVSCELHVLPSFLANSRFFGG